MIDDHDDDDDDDDADADDDDDDHVFKCPLSLGPESVEVVGEESQENSGTGLKRKFSKISIETISDDNK